MLLPGRTFVHMNVVHIIDVQARQAISRYYDGALKSDDSLLPCETRNVCLRSLDDGSAPGTAPPNTASAGALCEIPERATQALLRRRTRAWRLGLWPLKYFSRCIASQCASS